MKRIPLTRSKSALVDDEDYERLSQYKWLARPDWYTHYASRTDYSNGEKIMVQMHRFILGLKPGDGVTVDHINRNGLDNRKRNLRKAVNSENQYNCRKRKDNTSGYRGVNWDKFHGYWVARVSVNSKRICCGCFKNVKEAAKAYDKAVIKHRGKDAPRNFK